MSRPEPQHMAAYARILERYDVPQKRPPEVHAEVARLLAAPGLDDPRLLDLTGLPFVTIDYAESRDLDQAVHIERGPGGGGFVVRYALADAAWFVRPDSALFAGALRRGTSTYLPGHVVPMLPAELSEGIISLNPNVDRRSVVFVIRLDDDGEVLETELVRARIHSRAKLTYDGVQRYHDAGRTGPLADRPYSETLDLLRTVGELRIAEARARNVVSYDREEIDILPVPAAAGNGSARWAVVRAPRNQASRWNEQVSLLCNIEGGRLLVADGRDPQVQPVFRVHEPPPPEAIVRLDRTVRALLAVHGHDAEAAGWRRPGRGAGEAPLADSLERLHGAGLTGPLLEAIERQVLIINRAASYDDEPGMHYALGVQPYARFSAPMREVVGIFTHKEALEQRRLTDRMGAPAADEVLRERVIDAANSARRRQSGVAKAMLRLAIDGLLAGDAERPHAERPPHPGTVLGATATRLYVRLHEPPIEVKVYTGDAEPTIGARPRLRDDGLGLVGDATDRGILVGDAITLRVDRHDDKRDRWRFRIGV